MAINTILKHYRYFKKLAMKPQSRLDLWHCGHWKSCSPSHAFPGIEKGTWKSEGVGNEFLGPPCCIQIMASRQFLMNYKCFSNDIGSHSLDLCPPFSCSLALISPRFKSPAHALAPDTLSQAGQSYKVSGKIKWRGECFKTHRKSPLGRKIEYK